MVLWVCEPPNLHVTQQFYDALETVSDAGGRFEIPAQTRFVTAFVREPGLSVFAPGYLMQEPDVTPPGGRAYVDPTIVRMRPLKTREERCEHEPRGVGALFSKAGALRFADAVDEYVAGLACAELSEP